MRRLPDIVGGCLSSQPLRFLQDWLEGSESSKLKSTFSSPTGMLPNKDYTEEALEFHKEYAASFDESKKVKTVEDLQELAEDTAKYADLLKICDDNCLEEVKRHVVAIEELLMIYCLIRTNKTIEREYTNIPTYLRM